MEDFKRYPLPVFKLYAVAHDQISSYSKVFSIAEVEYFLFIQVPILIAKEFELNQVCEVKDDIEAISDEGLWEHDPYRMWYRFRTEKLNLDTGYHLYRLLFINKFTQETCTLYFSYVIQNNKPKQPYNYMEKYDQECNCNG